MRSFSSGGLDREHHLHAAIEVARHPVGARQIDLRLVVGAEDVDPAVLQEPIDDAADADVLGDARQARPQAADAANDQVDRHARLAGAVQGLDHAVIDQRVELGENPRRLAFAGPLRSALRSARSCGAASRSGATTSFRQSMPLRVAGEQVEQRRGVGRDVFVGGEQAQVGVDQRRRAGCSCRCPDARTAAGRCLPAARPATACSASSGPGSRTPRARPPVPAAAPS